MLPRVFIYSLTTATFLALLAHGMAVAQAPAIIPQPAHLQLGSGSVHFVQGAPLCAVGVGALPAATYLQQLLHRTSGPSLRLEHETCAYTSFAVRLESAPLTPSLSSPEAYTLVVDDHGITARASGSAGLFYAAVTIWQLLVPSNTQSGADVAKLSISDGPRFPWRGLMLDSARHMQSPQFIKTLLDQMALHKLNVLHWHLTDDQGWRIQILRYPRLTSVGAWRVPAGPAAAADIDPRTGKPRLYGGFYTQAQLRDIVAYATARHITIVPEIDMPGHATAAIAAYPELGSTATPPKTPSSDWGVHSNLLNVNESTFTFIDNVLDEVLSVFPSPYIHVGGDEAVKDQWKTSAEMQTRMHQLGITNEDALQAYFIQRVGRYLASRHRKLVGWDEILEGGLGPNAIVMSWHGVAGGIKAANAGHDAILTPQRPLYFNYRQSDATDEPPGRAPLNSLEDVYSFDPAPSNKVNSAERAHILGAQANLWTEHVRTEDRVEHMLFPRAAALAEVDWSPEQRNWQDFLRRLGIEFERYRELGLPAADSAFEVHIDKQLASDNESVSITLSNQTRYGSIRYTLDGAVPSLQSPKFHAPLLLQLPATIEARPFAGDEALVPATEFKLDAISVRSRNSQELTLCRPDPALLMEDDAPVHGRRAVFLVNYLDPCWVYPDADLSGVARIEVTVGQLPFNLQIGTKAKRIFHTPVTDDGELRVHLDRCDNPVIVTLPLQPATHSNALTTLSAAFPQQSGKHGLCFDFAWKDPSLLWALSQIALVPDMSEHSSSSR